MTVTIPLVKMIEDIERRFLVPHQGEMAVDWMKMRNSNPQMFDDYMRLRQEVRAWNKVEGAK